MRVSVVWKYDRPVFSQVISHAGLQWALEQGGEL